MAKTKHVLLNQFISLFLSNHWPTYRVWKKVIQKEMHLRDQADVSSRAFVDRDNCLRTNLKIFSRPDNARIDRAGRLSLLASVYRSFQCKFHERNQTVNRRWKVHVLHLRLQI